MTGAEPGSLSTLIRRRIADAGGWLPFDRFMAMALYAPGLGYYSRSDRQFGLLPASGSDFVTAPELSPLFGAALARQVAQALDAAAADTVLEFGAGSGALALQLLQALGDRIRRYAIVEVSGALRARQAATLADFADRVVWLDALPGQVHGVVVGNEVLDAMPVQLLHWDGQQWFERGVVVDEDHDNGGSRFAWADRPTALRPPPSTGPFVPGTLTELHLQAQAFIATLADRLQRGVALFIDYGFPEAEYHHPQRRGGTLMCHRGHRADPSADAPLRDVGLQDITAHIEFSALALVAQDAGLDVLGYTSQARFLMNCGLLDLLQAAADRGDLRAVAHAQKLLTEHEMGELFKVIAFGRGVQFSPLGFASGDRSHTL